MSDGTKDDDNSEALGHVRFALLLSCRMGMRSRKVEWNVQEESCRVNRISERAHGEGVRVTASKGVEPCTCDNSSTDIRMH